MSHTLMIQGCTSDAGKSTVVAGLCRALVRRGIKVAPFKPQNMALNSAVTVNGGEIGRAQAVQAQACNLEPHTDFNPVLLKPNTDIGAQVIIHGKAIKDMDAISYHEYKSTAMDAVIESHNRLSEQYDVILVEGAGSPAEVNLRDNDIANMGFAEKVDCPVILVADIDKGGVFAHLTGTLDCLSQSEQDRTAGFIINRFRGDIKLLESGLEWIENKTKKPVIGVVNYLKGLHIEAEDAINTQSINSNAQQINIVVPILSRISNHTDFDVLRLQPEVNLQFVDINKPIPPCDVVILPGTKSVRADLALLKQNGWVDYLNKHLRYGGNLIGVCGGFQMLGKYIHDPNGIEGEPGSEEGFNFFDFETTLEPEKQLHRVSGKLMLNNAQTNIKGYEIHAGISSGASLKKSLVDLGDRNDGVISDDNRIIGTYLHGLFDDTQAKQALLNWMGLNEFSDFNYDKLMEHEIDRLADELERALDIDQVLQLISE